MRLCKAYQPMYLATFGPTLYADIDNQLSHCVACGISIHSPM